MARRKKPDSSGVLVTMVVQLLGAILLSISFLAILLIVGAWLYFKLEIKKYQGVIGRDDFKLLPDDQQTLNDFTQAKDRIEVRIAEINKLRRTLPLRANGSFDSRNREGKNLNSELQALRSELEQCDRTIDQLTAQEEGDFRRWITIKSGLFSSRIAMFSIPVIGLILTIQTPIFIVNLSSFIERQTGLPRIQMLEAFYGIFAATSGVASITFLVVWSIRRMISLRAPGG